MKINVVAIGNSKGVRIPKAILEQCNIHTEVELEVKDGKIILEPSANQPRQGWDDQFTAMSANQDDRLLVDDALDIDSDDWEW